MKIQKVLNSIEYENKKWKDLILVNCEFCSKNLERSKGSIYRAFKKGYEYIFCSTVCKNKYSSLIYTDNIIKSGKKNCSTCGNSFNITEFHKNKTTPSGYAKNCKACTKKFNKKYYSNNTNHHKKNVRIRHINQININREFIINYLNEHPCIDCHENNILVLDFDHIKSHLKESSLCDMIRNGISLEKIKKEIKKCVVRCSNCHRIKTAKEQNNYKWQYINTKKQ